LSPDRTCNIRKFYTVRRDRIGQRGGGVLIYVDNRLKYKIIPRIYDCGGKIEACGIKVFLKGEVISLISCYCPPRSNISFTEWSCFLSQFPGKVILGGDFNLHNIVWDTDPWESNHLPIYICVNETMDPRALPTRSPRLHSGRTDWCRFRQELDIKMKFLAEADLPDVEVKYSSFVSSIEDALRSVTPHKKPACAVGLQHWLPPPSTCLWWNEECKKFVRLRKATLLKFRYSGLFEDFVNYKKQSAIVKRKLKRIKLESFRSFCAGLRKETSSSYVWNTIKKFQSRFNATDNNYEYNSAKCDRVRDQIEDLRVDWVPCSPPEIRAGCGDPFLDLPFSMEELECLFKT
ncbi:uncharacterized protein, partial [Cardiocondyla obscurior]|uniref:uncharacterized protein n=1 Tax=Cardiocondyla obscurior TaxID=286306 RepID=UPI0039656D87